MKPTWSHCILFYAVPGFNRRVRLVYRDSLRSSPVSAIWSDYYKHDQIAKIFLLQISTACLLIAMEGHFTGMTSSIRLDNSGNSQRKKGCCQHTQALLCRGLTAAANLLPLRSAAKRCNSSHCHHFLSIFKTQGREAPLLVFQLCKVQLSLGECSLARENQVGWFCFVNVYMHPLQLHSC